jgi:hypothetical protein
VNGWDVQPTLLKSVPRSTDFEVGLQRDDPSRRRKNSQAEVPGRGIAIGGVFAYAKTLKA